MTGTDMLQTRQYQSRSYLNHLVSYIYIHLTLVHTGTYCSSCINFRVFNSWINKRS